MLKIIPYLAIFCVIFCNAQVSLAQSQVIISNKISIEQADNQLRFKVEIYNRKSSQQSFKLSSTAMITSSSGLSQSVESDGSYILKIPGNTKSNIEYQLPYDVKHLAYYISSADLWIPVLQSHDFQTFSFSATLNPGYQIINSATGKSEDDLAFVFCRCKKYSNKDGRLNIYFINDDAELAQTLLTSLETYLARYERELGPYPYDQFSVVESIQEVGYAFPKMTWIGTQLLHFPFILKTSLPHELLHSWWGNGVFVDYTAGNWCEGLTSFGADYRLLDEEGRKLYRLKAITSYLDYAHSGNEIPLSKFISRGEDKSLQAIGYDKAMMVFLMAEQRVGENLFNQTLREFYRRFKYQAASYENFFSVLEEISHEDFSQYKKFWIYSVGLLSQDFIKASWNPNSLRLEWKSPAEDLLKIPGQSIATHIQTFNNEERPFNLKVNFLGSDFENPSLSLTAKPQSYSIDPDFLLFRDLNENEKPVTFSQSFASKNIKILTNNKDLNAALTGVFPGIVFENVNSAPDYSQKQVLFLDSSQLAKTPDLVEFLKTRRVAIETDEFSFLGQNFSFQEHSIFLSFKFQKTTVVVIGLGHAQSMSRWLQRWLHYGAKGYLVMNVTGADQQGLWLLESHQPL